MDTNHAPRFRRHMKTPTAARKLTPSSHARNQKGGETARPADTTPPMAQWPGSQAIAHMPPFAP